MGIPVRVEDPPVLLHAKGGASSAPRGDDVVRELSALHLVLLHQVAHHKTADVRAPLVLRGKAEALKKRI